MKITTGKKYGRVVFVGICYREQSAIMRSIGFKWDHKMLRWWTEDPEKAELLASISEPDSAYAEEIAKRQKKRAWRKPR